MRVIEPDTYQHGKKRKRSIKRLVFVLFPILVLIGGGGFAFVSWRDSDTSSATVVTEANDTLPTPDSSTQLQNQESEEPVVEEPVVQPEPVVEEDPDRAPLRQFADNDFKIFYDQLKQTGVDAIENPPAISGNVTADERIQSIAESRGYRLRGVPSRELVTVDGYPVQPPVAQSWLDLKAAAAKEGHTLSVVSTYRSVTHQKTLFLTRLNAAGATIEQVAAGTADDAVDEVLVTSSIPGYSKHHTGYTIDILCAGWAFENFKNSPCNTWITANNYEVAKRYGFIPSYPPGATKQGPDPEAWEYVWVGVDLLYE